MSIGQIIFHARMANILFFVKFPKLTNLIGQLGTTDEILETLKVSVSQVVGV